MILSFIHFKGYRQHSCFRQLYKTNYLIEWLAISHGCLLQMYQLWGKNLANSVAIYGPGREHFRPPTYNRDIIFFLIAKHVLVNIPTNIRNKDPNNSQSTNRWTVHSIWSVTSYNRKFPPITGITLTQTTSHSLFMVTYRYDIIWRRKVNDTYKRRATCSS